MQVKERPKHKLNVCSSFGGIKFPDVSKMRSGLVARGQPTMLLLLKLVEAGFWSLLGSGIAQKDGEVSASGKYAAVNH